MGLGDYVRNQLIEIIDWADDARDVIAHRFPDDDREIKRGAQLVVRESQSAVFVYLGEFADVFGPGTHTLTTSNIPVLTQLKSWKYGFESPFKADVYFVRTRLFAGNQWGTANPIMLHDQDFGVVRVRAFGTYDFRVVDVQKFLRDVVGTDSEFTVGEFAEVMRSRLVGLFSNAVGLGKISVLDMAGRFAELGDAILPAMNAMTRAAYGLELTSFVIENVSVPPEVEKAINTRTSLQATGNMGDYVKYQIAQAFARGELGQGAAQTGGIGANLAAGLVMAQQVLRETAGALGGASSSSQAPEVLTPADAAKLLNVSEADVIASLESGDLKGRKIGSQWRVTRPALTQFLQG